MARKAIPAGIGAIGKAKMNAVHPSALLTAKYGTAFERDYFDGLRIERADRGKVSNRGRVVDRYHVTHPDFPEVEFMVCRRNFTVVVAPDHPFEVAPPPQQEPGEQQEELALRQSSTDGASTLPIPPVGRRLSSSEIAELRARGLTVDDDDEPDELNAAEPPPPPVGNWITPTFCRRASQGHVKVRGKWVNATWDSVKEMDELELFLLCFPINYIKDVVLPETNKHMMKEVTMKEFFKFIGCIFFMSCHPGVGDRDLWWTKRPISLREGAPFRLNHFMKRHRFKSIMGALQYSNKSQPGYVDRFHDVRQMIDAWNNHMSQEYFPGWWNCLDESMSVCHNERIPGFMVVPRKPHPFGNEYHSICDGRICDDDKEKTSSRANPIMWHIELQEGKDRPPGAGPKKFSELGKTPGLMCRMHEPIKRLGKACTMDSGFCVSKGIVELEGQLGVYGQAYIKKRGRYWPRGVPGDMIDEYFADKEIGHCETLELEYEGKTMFIHCMKEEKWIGKFMSTFGTLDEVTEHKGFRRTASGDVHFRYREPFSWHNKAKHWIDDHNQQRHSPIDLAEIWKTQWWPHRQFTFILGVCEVNAANARGRARDVPAEPVLEFRKKLAMLMLENTLDNNAKNTGENDNGSESETDCNDDHILTTRPNFTGRWLGSSWKKTKQIHQKSYCMGCVGCKNRIRTYCSCNKSVPLCSACHVVHVMTLENDFHIAA